MTLTGVLLTALTYCVVSMNCSDVLCCVNELLMSAADLGCKNEFLVTVVDVSEPHRQGQAIHPSPSLRQNQWHLQPSNSGGHHQGAGD